MCLALFLEPDSTGEGEGVFEGDIMLNRQSRELVFGSDDRIAFAATAFLDQLWPNRTVYYTVDKDICEYLFNSYVFFHTGT